MKNSKEDQDRSLKVKAAIERVFKENEEILDRLGSAKIPGYKQTPPDWCDDCNAAPGGECPDCGCTHNC